MLGECGEFLFGRFPMKLKGTHYKSYVRPALLYAMESWCLKEILEFYEAQKDPC